MFRDVAEDEMISRVKRKSISNVSEMRSQSFSQPVMMEIVSETLHTNSSSHGWSPENILSRYKSFKLCRLSYWKSEYWPFKLLTDLSVSVGATSGCTPTFSATSVWCLHRNQRLIDVNPPTNSAKGVFLVVRRVLLTWCLGNNAKYTDCVWVCMVLWRIPGILMRYIISEPRVFVFLGFRGL